MSRFSFSIGRRRLARLLKCYFIFHVGPGPESESIRGPGSEFESEQPYHDSAPLAAHPGNWSLMPVFIFLLSARSSRISVLHTPTTLMPISSLTLCITCEAAWNALLVNWWHACHLVHGDGTDVSFASRISRFGRVVDKRCPRAFVPHRAELPLTC